uniref:DUF1985 domain-containing protein n=1 Tax=Cucumis melo TaxID=3656 RepID=A0A9I9EJL0_CUCME
MKYDNYIVFVTSLICDSFNYTVFVYFVAHVPNITDVLNVLNVGFKEGIFGHFLNFSITNQSSQLLLHLIQRMCKRKSTSQLHFLIGGRVLKFGLREFSLITSLNYHEIPDINQEDIKGGGQLKRVYFENLKNVTRQYLNVIFNISTAGTNEDRIKMAKLYYL